MCIYFGCVLLLLYQSREMDTEYSLKFYTENVASTLEGFKIKQFRCIILSILNHQLFRIGEQ